MALTRDAIFWDAFRDLAQKAVDAALLVEQLFEDISKRSTICADIKRLESEGDTITHEVVKALHQTWITPLDREEIHALISGLDDVLDGIDGAAARVDLYELNESAPEALELSATLVATTRALLDAVQSIQSIKDAEAILEKCRAIGRFEDEADMALRKGLKRLFREVKDPLEVMKWRDVFERLESATDRAEDVANVIEGIVLEHG
ncbi:MAG: DUF47 family protein [Deltaproteobacteria bacterium]|nr:DUF47 family protein [Deltaproteobacteria bacterium]